MSRYAAEGVVVKKSNGFPYQQTLRVHIMYAYTRVHDNYSVDVYKIKRQMHLQ